MTAKLSAEHEKALAAASSAAAAELLIEAVRQLEPCDLQALVLLADATRMVGDALDEGGELSRVLRKWIEERQP